jgi:hypothetical protein
VKARRIGSFLVVASLAGCGESNAPVETATPTQSDAQDDALCEAVVRWFLDLGFEETITTYFVEADEGVSLGPGFFQRFIDTRVRVKPVGADVEHVDDTGYGGYRDRATGDDALLITIESIEPRLNDRYIVHASYGVRSLYGGGYELIVKRAGEAWTVTAHRIVWQS